MLHPLLRKILDALLPSLVVSLVVFPPLSSLISLGIKRRCLLSVVILSMRKQSFAIDCYDESKRCHDHCASFVTSSQIHFNPVQTGPLGFFKSLTVEVEGDFEGSHPVTLERLQSSQTMKFRGFITHSKLCLPGPLY